MHTDRYEEGVDFITEKPSHSIHRDYSNGGERSIWHDKIDSIDLLYNVTVLCFFDSSREILEEFGKFILSQYPTHGVRCVITHIQCPAGPRPRLGELCRDSEPDQAR